MIRTGALIFAAIAFLAGGTVASAQVAPRPGITVQGRGTVRRPADLVRFVISIGNTSGRATPVDAVSGADALVKALKSAGVDDAAISNPLNNINAQRIVSVSGSLHKPTAERIRALIASTETALPANALTVQNVQVLLSLDDCTAALDAAEKAAFDDARDHAARLAADAHVTLGAASAILENDVGAYAACPTKPDRVLNLQSGFPGGFDATNALDVLLSVNTSVTFEIH
jgi:uncharacterized protein YggE